jgi:hypothetical protein
MPFGQAISIAFGSGRLMAYVGNDPHARQGTSPQPSSVDACDGAVQRGLAESGLAAASSKRERILRNTGMGTEPGDVQPTRRLPLDKIAPVSLPLIADFSRHGPAPRSCSIIEGASLAAAPTMSFRLRLRQWEPDR